MHFFLENGVSCAGRTQGSQKGEEPQQVDFRGVDRFEAILHCPKGGCLQMMSTCCVRIDSNIQKTNCSICLLHHLIWSSLFRSQSGFFMRVYVFPAFLCCMCVRVVMQPDCLQIRGIVDKYDISAVGTRFVIRVWPLHNSPSSLFSPTMLQHIP